MEDFTVNLLKNITSHAEVRQQTVLMTSLLTVLSAQMKSAERQLLFPQQIATLPQAKAQ